MDINEQQALLIEYIRHSDETWINGIRVGGEGTFEALWRFKETNPVGLVRVYELPAGFLKAKDNVLAIKVGIGFGNAGARCSLAGRVFCWVMFIWVILLSLKNISNKLLLRLFLLMCLLLH